MDAHKGIFRRALDGMIAARQRSAQRYVERYLDGYQDLRPYGEAAPK